VPRILVAGIGNIFLGDDGFGCSVAQRLAADPPAEEVRVVDYGIRGMHLAYDLLDGYDAVIIVDAPGTLRVLEVGADDLGPAGVDAHAMDPATVLGSLQALGGQLPRTLVVGCIPAELEERIGLTAPVAAAVERATVTVRELLENELGVHPASTTVAAEG
jgi:hydrogenase maturation protease